jgi:hypothetical protein
VQRLPRRSCLQSAQEEPEDEFLDAWTFALAVTGDVEHLDLMQGKPVGKELALVVRRWKCEHETQLPKVVAEALGQPSSAALFAYKGPCPPQQHSYQWTVEAQDGAGKTLVTATVTKKFPPGDDARVTLGLK